jgi:hypothetical protein
MSFWYNHGLDIYLKGKILMLENLLEYYRKSYGTMGRMGRKGDGERGRGGDEESLIFK